MKKEIIDAIVAELNKGAKAYQSNLNTLNTSIDLDEEATIDVDDISQKDQSTDISDDLSARANLLENIINKVKTYASISKDDFSPGALVETSDLYILVGIAFPSVRVHNKKVVGVSEEAELYPELAGKKQGDKITLGKKTYSILSVR
ncbi:MAG TPA: hypothetical protein PLQ65_06085 [Flavihumibacter sp.]|nr:hypothetical protein [Flavihumibacter sp.]